MKRTTLTSKAIGYVITSILLLCAHPAAQAGQTAGTNQASGAKHTVNGLIVESSDPKADEAAFKQMHAYLDKIRNSQHRPTVALVLSGGGAKGAAQVGALKHIEELGIPVDIIFGTSIGGLLGGLYAVGYDAEFLDTLISTMDWKKIMSDKIDPRTIPLSEKKYKSRYQLSFPFHYAKKKEESILKQEKYKSDKNKLQIGGENESQGGVSSVLSGLPSGYVYGFNVNNVISSLTVGYQDSISFMKLPIPFCCVATELVSCTERNWTSGELKTAMRSTMSIPGLFSPVRIDDQVLMDGGSRDNFPVDLAKAAGADIVIGIDLADAYLTSEEIDNMAKVLFQFIDLPARQTYETTKEMADVYIHPDLSGYNMLSFNTESIDTMMARGAKAAMAADDLLREVARRTKGASTTYHRKPAVNINVRDVKISEVIFDGLSHNDAGELRRLIRLDVDKLVNAVTLEKAASIIQATGAVESVTYSLLGSDEPYRLVFKCAPAPTHNFGASIRLDSEVWAEIGLNIGLNTHKLSGPKFDASAKIGKSQNVDLKFYLDYPGMPIFNFEASFANMLFKRRPLERDFYSNDKKVDMGYLSHEEKIYVSTDRWLNLDLQAGFRNVGYFMNSSRVGSIPFEDEEFKELNSGDYVGAYAKGTYSNYDTKYFPDRGFAANLGCNIDFCKAGVSSFQPIYAYDIHASGVIPLGWDRLKLIPDFHCRSVFDPHNMPYDKESDGKKAVPAYSFAHRNCIGGDIAGRYLEQQMPFIGFNDIVGCFEGADENNDYVSYDHAAVLNLELRACVIKNLYVSAMGGYVHMAPTIGEFFRYRNHYDIFGAALQLAYNTIVGPIKARFSWADRAKEAKDNFGFYISAGFDF